MSVKQVAVAVAPIEKRVRRASFILLICEVLGLWGFCGFVGCGFVCGFVGCDMSGLGNY